jgi:hypothetical protein
LDYSDSLKAAPQVASEAVALDYMARLENSPEQVRQEVAAPDYTTSQSMAVEPAAPAVAAVCRFSLIYLFMLQN